MIEINGEEGGGQILRTSASLAALEKEEIHIKNIRGSRPNPGLKEQHLKGLRALARACNGELKGDEKGSEEVKFCPGEEVKEEVQINIDTAGSIGLVLQQFFILGIKNSFKIHVKGGGTYVKWAPPVDYLKEVFLPLMNKYGYRADIEIEKEGFYPKGGGKVRAKVESCDLGKIEIPEKGNIKNIRGISKATYSLRDREVAERQAKTIKEEIERELGIQPQIEYRYVEAPCPGSGALTLANTDETILGADALGERGKTSEEVGEETAKNLKKELRGSGSVDVHMADQLIPYMAYSGSGSKIKVRKVTDHIETNIEVVEKILPVEFSIEENEITVR